MTTLVQFAIPPDQAQYAVTDGSEVLSSQLDGGAGRYRRDILNATSKVNVQWTVDGSGFQYIRSFYRSITVSGSLPFNIDLLLDLPTLTTHKAYFVPGSMQLLQQSGLAFTVGAQLEVYPADIDAYANDFVYMANEFGVHFNMDSWLDVLDELMNTDIPAIGM